MLKDVKRYAIFVKEDAIRDMQVLSNYGEVVENNYFDCEENQDWNDFYGSVFMTTIMVDEDEDLMERLESIAVDFNVSPESLEFIRIGLRENFGTYDKLVRKKEQIEAEASVRASQLYNLGVVLGNSYYEEEEICESVSLLLDSLDADYTDPDFVEGYENCHPENARSKSEILGEIKEKLNL